MIMGVAGISGRTGRLVAEEVLFSGARLSGGLTRHGEPSEQRLFGSMAELAAASEVVIDFTQADTAATHALAVAKAGCAWVLGTTGMSPEDEAAILSAASVVPVVRAANFAPGVALVAELVRQMAAFLPPGAYDAEILEMHHRQKRDAPSGTALAFGRAVAVGRREPFAPLTARTSEPGARPLGGVGFASLRGGQVIGDHTVLFAGDGENISIRHEALDRRIFARGAVRAALWTRGRPPGLYGMIDVLGLTTPIEESAPPP